MRDNNKDYLCPKCKTGQDTYLLDNRNPFCPYLSFHNGDNCSMFKPMSKKLFPKGNIMNRSDDYREMILGAFRKEELH